MSSSHLGSVVALLACVGAVRVATLGCGGARAKGGFDSTNGHDSGPGVSFQDGGPGNPSSGACLPGLACNVYCSGGTTSVTGTVYDPAGNDPLYNVAVYVPAAPLQPLPKGIPVGADSCSCGALFKSGALVSTATAVDGTFTLKNVPVGSNVPLVLQVGKWRRELPIEVTACQTNAQPDRSLTLPNTIPFGDTDDNIPDIAVSTGSADTLECLMERIGLSDTEYVAGTGSPGHVHVFAGGSDNGNPLGEPETPAMPGAPSSPTALWATQAELMPYDIVLLSCEGGETYNANPPALEAYLNAGGRVFASHFHYAWFSGPLNSGQTYTAPSDWGSNLATWAIDDSMATGPLGGVIDTTLNVSGKPFPKGNALEQWLIVVGALGQDNVPVGDLSIYDPRFNATVSAANVSSQPWITDGSGRTMYFSFDTPVNAPPAPDGGAPTYCGRAVFSDLHVGGDPTTRDNPPPPGGCDMTTLSPQERALEFMLFDLSSCVLPDTVAPPDAGPIQ
jgi:hypothetical protein